NNEEESWSIKQMISFEKRLNERLEKLNKQDKKDHMIYFEDLGVDFLFVDEAHVYKNLYSYTKLSNVAGVNASNSLRASDMEMKVKYLLEENNQRGVVFATGTPISNSMSEMFTMQKYLQPDVLEAYGVSHFDAWASTFGEIISSLEINPEGSGYQMKNRFAKFHNLPELMNMFNLVADIQTPDMLKLPVPEVKTGKAQIVVTEPI
ncbi:helicase SNF2, partial [Enterococcus hirae]